MVEEYTDSQITEALLNVVMADGFVLTVFAMNAFMFNSNTMQQPNSSQTGNYTLGKNIGVYGGLGFYALFFFCNFLTLLGVPFGASLGWMVSQYVYGYAFPLWLAVYGVFNYLAMQDQITLQSAGVDATAEALMQQIGREVGFLFALMGQNALAWNNNYMGWKAGVFKLMDQSANDKEEEPEEEVVEEEVVDPLEEELPVGL